MQQQKVQQQMLQQQQLQKHQHSTQKQQILQQNSQQQQNLQQQQQNSQHQQQQNLQQQNHQQQQHHQQQQQQQQIIQQQMRQVAPNQPVTLVNQSLRANQTAVSIPNQTAVSIANQPQVVQSHQMISNHGEQPVQTTQAQVQPTQIQFCIQGQSNQQLIAVPATTRSVPNQPQISSSDQSNQPKTQPLLAVSSPGQPAVTSQPNHLIQPANNHQRVLSVPMSPGGPNSVQSMPQSPNRPNSGPPPNSQPMFVRPVHQNNQIQMISPSGQIITGQNQPVNSHAQSNQLVNQPQPTLVDENGQIIHTVQQATPPPNDGQFKQIIMNQNGQLIQQSGPQGRSLISTYHLKNVWVL